MRTFGESSNETETDSSEGTRCCGMGGAASDIGASVTSSVVGSESTCASPGGRRDVVE